jgi:hypothetical protein
MQAPQCMAKIYGKLYTLMAGKTQALKFHPLSLKANQLRLGYFTDDIEDTFLQNGIISSHFLVVIFNSIILSKMRTK